MKFRNFDFLVECFPGAWPDPHCLVGTSLLLPTDTVFAHPGAQRAGVQAQEECRAVFPLDAPVGLLQHLKDMLLLQVGEGFNLLP